MAITFVGASSIEVGSSVTLTPPAGYAEGDLLIIFAMGDGVQSITNPAGWIGINPTSTSYVIRKIASSSESPVVLSPLSNAAKSFMVAYRGVDTTSPFNSNTTFGEDPSTSMNSVTGSVSIENSLVLRYWLVENLSGGSVITPPASVNVRAISDATSTYKGLLLTDELQPNVGIAPSRTATQTTEEYWTTRTIVLNPYVPPPQNPLTINGVTISPGITIGYGIASTPIPEYGSLAFWGYLQYYSESGQDYEDFLNTSNIRKLVTSGANHIATLNTANQATLWGGNSLGQITGSQTGSDYYNILSQYVAIAGGLYHTAGIKTDGTLWTWGSNDFGQLGRTPINSTRNDTPQQTSIGGSNWSKVACGFRFTAAIKTDGTLWTWGSNSQGQLGTGNKTDRVVPAQIAAGGNDWKDVFCGANGSHMFAIKNDNSLWGWGNNSNGQIGNNDSPNDVLNPVKISVGVDNWKNVGVGFSHTVAVKNDGTLWSWGLNNFGQLGDGTTTERPSPVQISSGTNSWKQVSCGQLHSAAVKNDGTLWAWGRNQSGQLGPGNTGTKLSPVQIISGSDKYIQVSCGADGSVLEQAWTIAIKV